MKVLKFQDKQTLIEFIERGKVVIEFASGGLLHTGYWVRQRWVLDVELTPVL